MQPSRTIEDEPSSKSPSILRSLKVKLLEALGLSARHEMTPSEVSGEEQSKEETTSEATQEDTRPFPVRIFCDPNERIQVQPTTHLKLADDQREACWSESNKSDI